MASTQIPQSRIKDLITDLGLKQDKTDEALNTIDKTVVGAINELEATKADISELPHVAYGLTHSISGSNLVIAPGYVLNHVGDEILKLGLNLSQKITTVAEGLRTGLILGDTAERVDILDHSTLDEEGYTASGHVISVDALGNYSSGFASGTVNSLDEGTADAVAVFHEGTTTSKQAGFLFNEKLPYGEYVITLASDETITSAKIAFYTLTSTTEKDDGSVDYEFALVSQEDMTVSGSTAVSFIPAVSSEFQMIAVTTDASALRYCRMYQSAVAATYNTYLCKIGSGFIIRLSLSDATISASYTNFAKVGQVTIGNGPVDCYPTKDIYSAYADGDLKQQEPSYSNFYTRREVDLLMEDKADRKHTLGGYGITDAYTKTEANNLLDAKQDALAAGTNIDISVNEATGELTIGTTFSETYGKEEVDAKFALKSTTLSGYGITDAYTKNETNTLLNAKQNANDEALTTENKTVVGAINEVNAIVITPLAEIVSALPEVGDPKKVYMVLNAASESELDMYNEYIYVDGKWELVGGGSAGGSGTAKPDNITTVLNTDESLTVIGVKTKSDSIKYDWTGTLAEWEAGRAAGTIPDEWFCYITDDGSPVVDSSDTQVYATIEYTDTMLNQSVGAVQTELTNYKTTNNTAVSTIQSSVSSLESRLTLLETAFGSAVDEINGEVI